MNYGIYEGSRPLGAPLDWDPNGPPCKTLYVRDEVIDGVPALLSGWIPTPEEIDRINRGAMVDLWVAGTSQPPVSLQVGLATKLPETTPGIDYRDLLKRYIDLVGNENGSTLIPRIQQQDDGSYRCYANTFTALEYAELRKLEDEEVRP